jgi:hypothetical protein
MDTRPRIPEGSQEFVSPFEKPPVPENPMLSLQLNDPRYMESMIFSLSQKLEKFDEMQMGYEMHLKTQESYPAWLKYYVHTGCKLPLPTCDTG